MAYVAGDPEKIREGAERLRSAVAQVKTCRCARCRMRGAMGPAVLVTLGVLFLLSELDVVSFGRTWPLLLIVIGLVQVLVRSADTSGHVDIFRAFASPAPPPRPEAAPTQNPEPPKVDHV